MSRGLTHPTAHVGEKLADVKTKAEYVYEGFTFDKDVESLTVKHPKYKILRTVGSKMKSGAIFKLKKNNKNYGIILYSRSITQGSAIKPGKIGMVYSGRKGASENLGIQAVNLIRGGKFEKRMLNGSEVECAVFNNKNQLHKSIIEALDSNPKVGNHIVDTLDDYFKGNLKKIEWDSSIRQSDINEVGKYVGELIIGYVALANKHQGIISTNIFGTSRVAEFIIPNDPLFAGVDSAFILTNEETVPISSKLGKGAKASVFSNLLPTLFDTRSKRTVAHDIVKVAKKAGISKKDLLSKRGGKDIVYEYGVRSILGLTSSVVSDPMDVYQTLRAYSRSGNLEDLTEEAKVVVEALSEHKEVSPNVKIKLPLSTTTAFTRIMATRLNDDRKTHTVVTEILSGKDFWQANLNKPSWNRGDVRYQMLRSGHATVQFIGDKAAIGDIEAKQGLLNYELKYQ